MSNAHPMTKPYALATLDGFKARIDRAFNNVADTLEVLSVSVIAWQRDAINLSYKRHGGLHFIKLGLINLQLSVSKPDLQLSVSKPVIDETINVDLSSRISRFIH